MSGFPQWWSFRIANGQNLSEIRNSFFIVHDLIIVTFNARLQSPYVTDTTIF